MSDTKLTRHIEVSFEPTPEDLAFVFAAFSASQQAIFFARVWTISKEWPGAGWCQQSYEIAKFLSNDGRSTLSTLNAHVFPGDGA